MGIFIWQIRKASPREAKKCVQIHRTRKRSSRNSAPGRSVSKPSHPVGLWGTQQSRDNHGSLQELEVVFRMLLLFSPSKGSLTPCPDFSRNRGVLLDLSADCWFAFLDLWKFYHWQWFLSPLRAKEQGQRASRDLIQEATVWEARPTKLWGYPSLCSGFHLTFLFSSLLLTPQDTLPSPKQPGPPNFTYHIPSFASLW